MKLRLQLVAGLAVLALLPATAAPRSGVEIVKAKCISCHQTGKHGAPKIGDRDAWVPHVKKGLDATIEAAIRGHGAMPARGGLAEITDAELRSAVVYMLNPGGPPKPAPAPVLGPNQRIVDGMKILLGTMRVKDGIYRVTVTLRDSATGQVIDNADVDVRVTNPVMGDDAKKLDRVSTQGIVSFGNEFRISGKEPHAINVQVRRPGSPRLVETTFDFKG